MKAAALLAILLLGGCMVQSPALVFAFERSADGLSFRHCQVKFGWWMQELIDQCGAPRTFAADAGKPSSVCAIYDTQAATFVAGTGVQHLAVCLEPSNLHNDAPPLKQPIQAPGVKADTLTYHKVVAVYGLSSPPAAIAE